MIYGILIGLALASLALLISIGSTRDNQEYVVKIVSFYALLVSVGALIGLIIND